MKDLIFKDSDSDLIEASRLERKQREQRRRFSIFYAGFFMFPYMYLLDREIFNDYFKSNTIF
ncbi:hypothetical protein [Methanoculleus sp.]|uniref:hypothetical protein n=1 Tax=Methanoculleus sp. TaxID=90427 RepID=UPI0025CF26E9|nr:hypothetical protein [Methanoculleus sp.]MCK9320316.1 hypothetical protein [Methanoculleus sp.]